MDQVSVTWLAACSSWPPFTQLSDTTLSLDDVLSKPLIFALSLEPHVHFHWLWPVHRPPQTSTSWWGQEQIGLHNPGQGDQG